MIDTIVAQFETTSGLPSLNWEISTTTRGTAVHTRYFCSAGTVRLTVQQNWDGQVRMRVEASLPKIIQGHNIVILNAAQIRDACAVLHQEVIRLASDSVVPPVEEWGLTEVHWCYAWRVDSPGAVINALAETSPHSKAQRKTREDDGHGGFTFRRQPRSGHGDWSEQVYDKGAETLALLQKGKIELASWGLSQTAVEEMARGVLRFEVITRKQMLRGVLGTPPTIALLHNYLDKHGTALLSDRWDRLTVNWRPTSTSGVAQKLRVCYPNSTATNLFDFWHAVTHIGVSEYRQFTGIDADKWRRQVRRLKEAGIGLGDQVTIECPTIPIYDG